MTDRDLRAFARRCALDVVHLWAAPDVVVRFLKTGREELREKASSAAYAADAAYTAADAAYTAAAAYAAYAAYAASAADDTALRKYIGWFEEMFPPPIVPKEKQVLAHLQCWDYECPYSRYEIARLADAGELNIGMHTDDEQSLQYKKEHYVRRRLQERLKND